MRLLTRSGPRATPPQERVLLANGYRCIRPDRRGFGQSSQPTDRILPFESTAARLRDENLIANLTLVEVENGPHNIGWTYPEETNAAMLEFLNG
jgi:pimeloyl-ACP methyl ester carboxylesterase